MKNLRRLVEALVSKRATRRIVWLPLCAMLAWASAVVADAPTANRPETDPMIAEWRGGEVRLSDYLGWLDHRQLEDVPATRRSEIEQMLLTQQLAGQAIERGLGVELAVVLRDMEHRGWQRVWRQAFDAAVVVTATELDTLAKANAKAFDQPRKVRLRNLFLRFPEDADRRGKAAVRRAMEGLRDQLTHGADFADLARRHSDSESRYRGGLLSVVSAGDLPPEVDKVAMALAPGQVSEVLESTDGVTLLRCDKIHAAIVHSLDEVRERIELNLRRLRTDERWQAERTRWLDAAQPVYDLARARDPNAAGDAVVLRFAGDLPTEAKRRGQLTVADLEVLLARKRGVSRTERTSEALRTLLEEHLVAFLAWRRADQDGLIPDQPEVARQIAWRQQTLLASKEITHRVQGTFQPPNEDDTEAFFDAHRDQFERLPHYELDLIWLDVEPDDPRPAFQLAERLVRQIKDGKLAFAEAARTYSRHPSAGDGGSLGTISRKNIAGFGPDPYHAVVELSPGEVSTPVRLDGRIWIFHLVAFEALRPQTFEEARTQAGKMLAEQRIEDLQREILLEMRTALDVRIKG